MTTAHRPTFDPARGKEAQRGVAYHQRLLPAHTKLKHRQPGQGGDADAGRDLRAQLLEAEKAHFAKKSGTAVKDEDSSDVRAVGDSKRAKHAIEDGTVDEEDVNAKRRRVLEETRDIDAESESEGDEEDESSEEESDDDDEAALMAELEKVKRERAAQKEQEEREQQAVEQEQREKDIALGNPLLDPSKDFSVKRRWDDDVVFKNQARGTDDKRPKEFVNDLLRSDFHKRFMGRYVR